MRRDDGGERIGTSELENVVTPTPLWYGDVLNLSFFIWSKPELNVEVCETEPYERDGSIPLIFLQIGWLEVMFYNHRLYNFLYNRKYGYLPEILK